MSWSLSQTALTEAASGNKTYTITATRSDTSAYESGSYGILTGDGYPYSATDSDFVFSNFNNQYLGYHYVQFSIAPGQATVSFNLTVVSGDGDEGTETFGIEVGSSINSTLDVTGTLSEAPPTQLSIASASVNEGNTGSSVLNFTVTRTDTSGSPTATYTIANGTTDATDFGNGFQSTGTVTFAAGATTATISVPVRGDYVIEANETFTVTLSNPTDAGIATNGGVATGTITNDDEAGLLAIGNPSVAEGNTGTTNLVYGISRSGGSGDINFTLGTDASGTATAGTDFIATSQNFSYVSGVLYANNNGNLTPASGFVVQVKGDYAIESNETVFVSLSNAPGTLFYSGGTGTILNDDAGGSFSVADTSVTEGDSLSSTGFFTITRTGGSAAATVSYLIGGAGSSAETTATAGVDYSVSQSGTVSFAAGQTTASVPFTVLGDTIPERNESFQISLTNPTNGGSIGHGVGIATIIDNDAPAGSQFGTAGNDILIANMPGAALIGGAGNDTFLVNSAADQVIEQNGGGTDIVYTTTSYNLGANEVEALSTAQQTDTTAINLIGNYATQTIVGNYGDNVLNGGSGGVDTLIGLYGNDTYAVGDSRTVVQEQAGQGFDTLVTAVSYQLAAGVSIELLAAQDRSSTTGLSLGGNAFDQTIAGTAGADTLSGGGGNDVLLGGAGADSFAFTTALATGSVATLADFVAGTDHIQLSTGVFSAVGATLDANEFVTGTAATTADQHIVYNATTGQVFYDADGSGSGAAVLFAVVAPGTALSATDFAMITPAATTA
jgi:hypothetical protein